MADPERSPAPEAVADDLSNSPPHFLSDLPLPDESIWRERGEPLVPAVGWTRDRDEERARDAGEGEAQACERPAIFDLEERPTHLPQEEEEEPAAQFAQPASALPFPVPPAPTPPGERLSWPDSLTTILSANCKPLLAPACFFALGAATVVLAIGLSNRRPPLPPGLEPLSPAAVREGPPLWPEDGKAPARAGRKHRPKPSLAARKLGAGLVWREPPGGEKGRAAQISLAGSRQSLPPVAETRARRKRSPYADEADVAAPDTVRRYGSAGRKPEEP